MERTVVCTFRDDFIEKLCDFVLEHYVRPGKDISRLAFVFGGRRPALFLKRALARRLGKGFLSPRFFSTDEFVGYLLEKRGAVRRISEIDACYLLYTLAREKTPGLLAGKETFSRFLDWAKEILSFIEQLDLEAITDVPLESIELKAAIGYDVPDNINALLKDITVLRRAFHELMRRDNSYSRGLSYLSVARDIDSLDTSEFECVFFCGFYYLHKTEKEIMGSLHGKERAVFFLQADGRPWSVLEKLSKEFSFSLPEAVDEIPRSLSLHAGFDMHSQAGLVRQLVERAGSLEKTVVVVPDAEIILPMVAEIAPVTDRYNVSMGYPLNRSSLYSLFESIIRAQDTRKNGRYYARDYLKVLSHPLVKSIRAFAAPAVSRVLVHKIEEIIVGKEKTALGGSLFVAVPEIGSLKDVYEVALEALKGMDTGAGYAELKDTLALMHRILFECWQDISSFEQFAQTLSGFLEVFMEKSALAHYPLNVRMAQKVYSIVDELHAARFRSEPFDKDEIFRIFKNSLDSQMIAFAGSPLAGLQILGLLETRSLNFETVIMVDVNEAMLPQLKIFEPLIPREVTISLGLNRLEKEEEIQRYQFMRLVAGAREVHLVYRQGADKERSRFIEELAWEKQKADRCLCGVPVDKVGFRVKVIPTRLRIKKNPAMVRFLSGMEFSASSINTYLHCPLRFYYHYVLGLRQKEDIALEPEAADIGTFVHELLEESFSRFVGRRPVIDEEFRKEFFALLDDKFVREFEHKTSSDAFLIKEILLYRLRRFLDNEQRRPVAAVVGLESSLKGAIRWEQGPQIAFQAVIDRIDRQEDGSLLIIDYKTGSADIMPVNDPQRLSSLAMERRAIKHAIKSFQLPLYVHLLLQERRFAPAAANACLYSLKDSGTDRGLHFLFADLARRQECEGLMARYLEALGFIVRQILDGEEVFEADEEEPRLCGYCPFFYLCR